MQSKETFTLKSTGPRNRLDYHPLLQSRFEMEIIQCTFIRIGIFHTKPPNDLPVGSQPLSYSYSSRGYKFNNGVRELYGEPYGAGDIITVETGLGYIRFYKNGIDQGVAYWNVPGNDLYVGYSMYGLGEIMLNHSKYQVYLENENDFLMKIWG